MEDVRIKNLSFTKRPISIPADYRPMYKIAKIVLILKNCCRSECSDLLKSHLFSWALKSQRNMDKLKEYVTNNFTTEFSVWGIEPALNRALQFAVAEKICELVDGKKYQLTEKGNKFFDLINKDDELFVEEKAFLKFIGKNKITDKRLQTMSKQWSLSYA